MKYTEEFQPRRGDRVIVYGRYKGVVTSISEDEVGGRYKDRFDDFMTSYFSQKISDIRFIRPARWWQFWYRF